MPKNIISLEGINENNLKNINVEFTLNEITTITGNQALVKPASALVYAIPQAKEPTCKLFLLTLDSFWINIKNQK